MQYLKLLNGDAMQLSSQILDTMHYLQQPVSHRHHVQPAHQPTQSLHHGTSAPFSNHSGGSNTLLGQRLRNVTHRSNAAAVHVPGGTVAHATSDAFQPSLCKKRIIVSHCRYCYYQQYYCCRVALLLLLLQNQTGSVNCHFISRVSHCCFITVSVSATSNKFHF